MLSKSRHRILALIVCFLTSGYSSSKSSAKTPVTYDDVIESYWQWRLSTVPEFATATGLEKYNNKLEAFTPEAFARKQSDCLDFLRLLNRVPVASLTPRQRTDLAVLHHDVYTVYQGYQWSQFNQLNTINMLEGVHHDYTYWLDATNFNSVEDFDMYIVRLRALATQIHEQIRLLEEAVARRWTNHQISMESVAESIYQLVSTPVVSSPFYRPFNESLYYLGISWSKKDLLREQARSVIGDHVMPAYSRLYHFLKRDYLPNTRASVSISTLPGGNDFYKACLKWYLSYDVSPHDLHNMGHIIVSDIMRRLKQMKDTIGYIGHIKDFMKYVHAADMFIYDSGQQMLDKYRAIVHEEIMPKLKDFFIYYKVKDIQVQPMMFDGPLGIMMPGSEDGLMPPVFFVNINQLYSKPKWKMKALSLHEIIPGKYLQLSYERNQSLPKFRQWRENRKMYAVPFQFPFYTAYTEGWALYAEYLGREMDLLLHPFDTFGQLHSELYRACELVVDTGIHAIGWERDEAVEYLTTRTGCDYQEALDSVTRIITLPGQACAPLYGYLKIKQLRELAETRLGLEFDVAAFHDVVLSAGPMPLNILEDEIERWLTGSGGAALLSSHVVFLGPLACIILTIWNS